MIDDGVLFWCNVGVNEIFVKMDVFDCWESLYRRMRDCILLMRIDLEILLFVLLSNMCGVEEFFKSNNFDVFECFGFMFII